MTKDINRSSPTPTPNQGISNKKEKPWYLQHLLNLGLIITFLFFFAYPYIFTNKINTFPELTNLETHEVRIIEAREREPHFIVEMPDKSIEQWAWPVELVIYRKRAHHAPSYDLWSDAERMQLVGCTASIRGVPLQWNLFDRFRVWELSCPSKNIFINLEATFADYQKVMKISEHSFYYRVVPFYIVFSVIVFLWKRYTLKKERLKEQETKSS